MTEPSKSCHEAAARHSDPLFVSRPWMHGGHNLETANGTLTYIHYDGAIYSVTCAHVYYEQFAVEPNVWLTIHGKERYVYQLVNFTANGYRSSLRPLRKLGDSSSPDIAILRLDEAFKEIHLARKGKEPYNLDRWQEPTWSELKVPVAFGYPTAHKSEAGGFVQAPLVAVAAELTKPISPANESFLMASSLSKENTLYFSGMSGGGVYCISDGEPEMTLVGITFEGFPGSSKEFGSRSSDSFLTKREIQIRAYTVTPSIFSRWLELAGFQ